LAVRRKKGYVGGVLPGRPCRRFPRKEAGEGARY
jgi:hypothetical protein